MFGNRGNGQSYGWNLSSGAFARDRNNVATDQQHDTFNHTQLYGVRVWELAVPNGSYRVHIVAGAPNFFDSTYQYNVEGTWSSTARRPVAIASSRGRRATSALAGRA